MVSSIRSARVSDLVSRDAEAVAAERLIVPAAVQLALCLMLVVAATTSLPFIGRWGPLPTTTLLDAWVIVFVVVSLTRGRLSAPLMFAFLTLYLAGRICQALFTDAPPEDFLQAHRWILYLIAFCLATGRYWGSVQNLVRVMWILLIFAFIKATVTFALLGPGERPGLLLENNFELALFCGLVITLYRFLGKNKFWAVALMGGLTVLAGSRSGAIAYLILAIFAISQAKNTKILTKYLLALATPAFILVPIWIFRQRSIGATQVDRLNFLDVFINETNDWNLFNWIFGTIPITPLSNGACSRLFYYQLLFSSEGDGSCYSVILHAFVLRVLFDAGIFGLVLAFGVTWFAMRRAKVQFTVSIALLLVAFTNSLSVSGLNNPYVALPILLALVTSTSVLGERKVTGRRNEIIARRAARESSLNPRKAFN